MFELIGRNHNEIDGTYCYGYLQYVGVEYGSRGQICIYRCPMCGREIRHVEGFGSFGGFGSNFAGNNSDNDNGGFNNGFGDGWF